MKTAFSYITARFPALERPTLESALKHAIHEVFVGWPGKWETASSWNSGNRIQFGFNSEHAINGMKMEVRVNVTQTYIIVVINVMEEAYDIVVPLHHSAVPHGIEEPSTSSEVDHNVSAMIIKTLKDSVTSCRKAMQKTINNGSNLDSVLDIVARWKS